MSIYFQQNGKVEHAIYTINIILRTYVFEAALRSKFWAQALLIPIHSLNILPTATFCLKTPFEVPISFSFL